MTRRPLSSGSKSLASSPRTSMPTRRGPSFSSRASSANGVAIRRGLLVLRHEQRAGQERYARVGIEHRDGQRSTHASAMSHRFDLQPVLDLLRGGRHGLGQPRVGARRSAGGQPAQGRRHVLAPPAPALVAAIARALAATPLAFHARHVNRAAVDAVVHPVGLRLKRRRRRRARLGAPSLITQSDEEGGDVLAVPTVARREGGASAAGRESRGRELEVDAVGHRVGATNLAPRGGILDHDVLDRMAADVVVSPQVRAGAEQATQSSVVETGKRFGER